METHTVSINSVILAVYLTQSAALVSAATFVFTDSTAHILQLTGADKHSNNMLCWPQPQRLALCLAQAVVSTVAQMVHVPIGLLSHTFQAAVA
jgi:hypothetical protein